MDPLNGMEPPEAFRQIQWIADTLQFFVAVGWVVNYGYVLWNSYTEETYSMSFLPLCNNIGWEMTYVLIHPSPNPYEFGGTACWLMLNFGIMWLAARALPKEFAHAPLIAGNANLITVTGILVCFAGHVSLAATIHPGLAYWWGAFICQLSLSVGALTQLLSRNSTRGASVGMW